MNFSATKASAVSVLFIVAVATTCLLVSHAYADTPITIVNNLEQSLVFKEIKNREHIQIKSDPPDEIPAHSSGQFNITFGSTGGNKHLNVKYSIKDTSDQVGVVYKYEVLEGGSQHCPKEHPDWTTETVEHCANWDTGWTYTFSPK